jgi:glucose-6-phosphate 1-dehydrogenase
VIQPNRYLGSTDARRAEVLALFGATGDLAQRMLLPSLYALHADSLLTPTFRIIGCSRRDLSATEFRNFARVALETHVPRGRMRADMISEFLARLDYRVVEASESSGYAAVKEAVREHADHDIAIFLSTAPVLFGPTVAGLKAAGLAGGRIRIALEKPLGHDLVSSCTINDAILDGFPEEATYRVDHYLGKETVQNLMALRFGNVLFEPLWNSQSIDHVQITISETIGVEGRGDYYDRAGALRDMVQSHMLQLLAIAAMEPPARFDGAAVRDEKIKVLRSLRSIDRHTVRSDTILGQYEAGIVGGERVSGYADELGHASNTETFVALRAHIDNWRWKGVPFYLRTGKRLAERRTEIAIQFKSVPHSIFAERGGTLQANKMRIQLQPKEDVRLLVMVKIPGLDREGMRLREVSLDLSLSNAFAEVRRRIAYERLLLDLIEGDPTLFVRRDEVEAQWTWIDQLKDGWSHNEMVPRSYAAGTWGPSAAVALAERNGVSWCD